MKFKLHKINMAPKETGLKHLEVSIQVSELGSRHGAENILGPSCRSKAELDEVVSGIIRELKTLRFPN